MKSLQFIGCDPETFQAETAAILRNLFEDFVQRFMPPKPNDYMTRAEVAEMLDVDISTIANWQRKGILNPLGIGNRVYFLRSEVEASVKPLNGNL
ncbi:helix-turn-helix domain-containing protein [Flavobacterium caeni]|uniref:Helix-turn-helix domain-containing protein n=1 Tax=Flavobacterium caeni TaxID=490189 RepID=A0A1G5EGH8_9FLAO|nr:helix-turn-helix domain-containing protein [Flavobacterium caeni]SCY25548.1 Helix-turn-helix domain-containing protein [Flavobacterium caeni]